MNYQDLRDHILGSHLMRHHLEAFLIQSAYIEGFLKYIADFHLFSETNGKSHAKEGDKLLCAVKTDIEKYSLSNLIRLLKRSNIITKEQSKLLDQYRQKRNRVLHDLLKEVTSDDFDKELVAVYKTGEKITLAKEFKHMEKLFDEMIVKVKDKTTKVNRTPRKSATSKVKKRS